MRCGAEIIAGKSGPLLPDRRIYYLFEVGKSIHVLRPMSIRSELRKLGR